MIVASRALLWIAAYSAFVILPFLSGSRCTAFTAPLRVSGRKDQLGVAPFVHCRMASTTSESDQMDCGCQRQATLFSGKPPSIANALDLRQAIRGGSVYTVYGEKVQMDDLIGNDGVSIVVFLRSLG